ncbi:MAG: PQQ-binding-like beta-propeller repeat protein [Verrucomicrobiales bacterium]
MKPPLSLISLFLLNASLAATADWPAWRGPNANGIAEAGQDAPVTWSETENVVWKSPVPGRGHSSPVVVGERIFLTTANETERTQSVIGLDRRTGRRLWQTEVNRGGFPERIHRKNSHATPTPACDGDRVFVSFFNHGGIQLAALDLDGDVVWSKRCGPFKPKYPYGYAPSPLLHGNAVIVASEFEDGGFLAAFDREDGREIWRAPRTATTNYSSPIVAEISGKEQLLLSGAEKISSFDPNTGELFWAADAGPKVTAGTVVWTDDLVFASGGFPEKETAAVRADGSGEVVWRKNVKCYEQSMVVHEGCVYAVDDGGIAYCWKADDGTEMWVKRLGGPISASPVLADGRIHASTERGATFVFEAKPGNFESVAENQLGDEAFATPTICGGRIYLRVAHFDGEERRELLYCLGRKS